MIKFARILILFAIVAILPVACGLFGDSDDAPDCSILRAVPSNAGVIVKASDLCALCSELNNDNQIWTQLKSLSWMKGAANIINTMDTIVKNRNDIRTLLKDRNTIASFCREGKNNVCALICVEISANDVKILWKSISEMVKKRKYTIAKDEYDKESVVKIIDSKRNPVFYIAYVRNLLIASVSQPSIEQAIRHLKSGDNSIIQDKTLRPLLKWAGANVSAVLIFNHQKLGDMFSNDLSAASTKTIKKHAGWSVLDISLHKQLLTCAGYTDGSQSSYLLSILKSQKPVKNTCANYLPSKTTAFVSLGMNDMHLFEFDYINHLKSCGMYADFQKADAFIDKEYGFDFSSMLYENVNGRVTEFSCTYSLAGRGNDHYIIAELSSAKDFESKIAAMCKKALQKEKISEAKGILKHTTSAGNTYTVYYYPLHNTFHRYFGDIFPAEAKYFMRYKDLAVFGQTPEALFEYANNIDNGKKLANNSIYDSFRSNVGTESNLYYYIDVAYSHNDVNQWLSKAYANELSANYASIQNLRSFAIQYSTREDAMFYTNAAMMYNSTIEADRLVSWLAPTDSLVCSKPQLLSKHYTNEKEVLAQDETYKLYLFDKTGKRYFAKQLGEPLTSQIFQIDLYGNDKKQYVFATENFLHAIDHNGNYLDNFPVQLPAKVSTDISIFDYENTLNYRIFVPCSDNYLYVYTKEGKQLETWTPLHTNYPIVTPVQYFSIGDNDYLVFSDHIKTYILNRRGEVRINVTNSFTKAKNSLFYVENPNTPDMMFVTTNSSGEVKYIFTDGSCKSKSFKTFTANHYFVYHDIDGDGKCEYIYTDGDMLNVYRENGDEVFSYCCDGSLGRPNIFTFSSKDVRIGVTSRPLGKIFLFDNKGNICSGFPLDGISEFSIGKLNSNKFSVVVGNSDNYIYNYLIF